MLDSAEQGTIVSGKMDFLIAGYLEDASRRTQGANVAAFKNRKTLRSEQVRVVTLARQAVGPRCYCSSGPLGEALTL
jgi:hypothetical protein